MRQVSIALREAQATFVSACEGDTIHIELIRRHPIVKIRFSGCERLTGEFVDHKHGVVRIRDEKKRLVSIPTNVVLGAELARH